MKNLVYWLLLFTVFVVLLSPPYLNAQDTAVAPIQKRVVKPFRIRVGIGMSGFIGRKTGSVVDELRAQGFGDTEHSFTPNPLLGSSAVNKEHPFLFQDYAPLFLWADGVLFNNLLVGLQRRHFTVEVDGFRFLYQSTHTSGGSGDEGHYVEFRTETSLLEPKIGWIDRSQHVALYGGPAFARHRIEAGNKNAIGYWGGAEAMLRGKRWGLFFFRFFAEYHFVPKADWASETYSMEYQGQTYTSQFEGAEIDLSFFTLGIGTGLSF